MKIVKQLPAYLMGLLFAWGGISYLFKLVEMPPQTGDMATFMKLFGDTGYMTSIKIFELIGGILLFLPKTRAIGWLVILPISINILLFELHLAHQPGIGVACVLLCALGIYLEKDKYMGLIS